MYGIPNMKLDKSVIERRRKLMEAEGVVFKTGQNIGENVQAADILKKFDAVALCCGAKKPRALAVKDADKVKEIHYAVDFLTSDYEESSGYQSQRGHLISVPKVRMWLLSVGGDTGNDCVGTCIRQGCKSVTQLEMMPEPPAERAASNPWPEWPKVLKD
jgi:glutamate synthase (NADPH/NADH) small chain